MGVDAYYVFAVMSTYCRYFVDARYPLGGFVHNLLPFCGRPQHFWQCHPQNTAILWRFLAHMAVLSTGGCQFVDALQSFGDLIHKRCHFVEA